MGFGNCLLNKELLNKYNDNVNKVIEYLLSDGAKKNQEESKGIVQILKKENKIDGK
jgi:hypothetical protein